MRYDLKKNTLIIFLFLLVASFSVNAQVRDISVVTTDSLPVHLYDYLLSSTSKHFHDPSIPRFLIKDRNENFVLGIGGYVQSSAFYDRKGLTSKGFSVNEFVSDEDAAYLNEIFEIYSNFSTVYLKLIGKTNKGMINAYIRTNFTGGNGGNRMSHAYLEYLGFTIGRALTTFGDSESPTQLDMGGAVSFTQKVVPLVRYSFRVGKYSKFAVSIESSQSVKMITSTSEPEFYQISNMSQTVPDFPISYTLDKGGVHLFLSTSMRYMNFRKEFQRECKNAFAYAGQISLKVDFWKTSSTSHSLYGNFVYTDGMSDCISITSGLGQNVIFYSDDPNDFSISQRCGAYIGYQYRFGQNEINALCSITEPIKELNFGYDLFKSGEYFAANYVRHFMTYGTFGAEFLWGRKTTVMNNNGSDWRIVALLRYDF